MFNKKYKKGMADAAKAYEAFGKKQEDAINQILEEVREQGGDFAEAIKNLNVNIDGLYDYLQSKEKAQLYTVYTPFDIKELGKEEQLFLIGALFRLTTDKAPNEHQQDYLRSIQRYLDIKEPPFGTDPLAIENIEDIPAQKAILQAVMEYLYLQDGDSYDETELQQEFLDAFSVNNKGRQAIFEQVERLYKATGARGLAEKYGYVVEEEVDANAADEAKTSCGMNGISEKLAKKIYSFPSSGVFVDDGEEYVTNDVLETRDFILIKWEKEIGHHSFSYSRSLRSICKANGKEKVYQNVDGSILNEEWYSTKSVENIALIFTSNNELYSFDIETGDNRLIYRANKDYYIVDVTKNEIFLHRGYGGECLLLNWNGVNIIAGMNPEAFTKSSFFYDDKLWSLHSDGDKLELFKFSNGKGIQSVLKADFEGYADTLAVHRKKLFILANIYGDTPYGFDKRKICSISLETPTKLEVVREKFLAYDGGSPGRKPLKSLENGWVFVEDKTKYSHEFNLNFFSFETGKTVTLAKGCGSYSVKKHLFGEDDIFFQVTTLKTIGNYVFFQIGDPYSSNGSAMVSIYEPMNVKLLS